MRRGKVELLIIRHGQSEADLLGVHEGRSDFSLTELGEDQAKKVSLYLSLNYSPDIIVTSQL
jgi:2,3-bisphosphoglycerate-dependent phosphoglycerate mutase